MSEPLLSRSGRPLDELTIEAVREGALAIDDFAIGRERLEAQARAAEADGHPQLADNLRRAGEMTALSNERVMQIYELLRPGRANAAELVEVARDLAQRGMPRLAAFIAEAADAYHARGLSGPALEESSERLRLGASAVARAAARRVSSPAAATSGIRRGRASRHRSARG